MSLVVSYKEQREQAHLAGRSVAEARKMYTPVLNIPDKAQAKLNGKEVKRKLEAETILDDGDELYFYEKVRNRKLILIGALMGALALTGGMFAYTYTTASATISAVAKSDFAKVEPYETLEFTTKVFGHYRGNIPSGRLFKITPDADYTGDLSAKVYLTNADELGLAYKHLNMKFELLDANGVTVNVDWRNEYEQAHRHFEEWCGVFDAASDAFNTTHATFADAEAAYRGGGDISTFMNAVDTYLDAIATYQSAITTHQDAAASYYAVVFTKYRGSVSGTHQNNTDTWAQAGTTFDNAVSDWKSAVATFIDKVNAYRAGTLSEPNFLTAVDNYLSATSSFYGVVGTWHGACDTFDDQVDAYLKTVISLGHEWQLLTLDNGQITLDFSPAWGVSPFYVNLIGGSFATHARSPLDWASGYSVEPVIYCEVIQR